MSVEQAWYHYPGDPEGTVRLWNGRDWVGFPSQPPPGSDGAPAHSEQTSQSKRGVVAKPFKNQVRLAPYALLAVVGLAGTVGFAVRALLALRDELDVSGGRDRRFLDRDTVLVAPFEADVYRQLLIAGLIGGLLFLIWLWRANSNIGATVGPKRNSGRQWGIKMWFFGALFVLVEATFRTVLGPVITRMSNCVERSTPGGSGGIGLTMMSFAWWMLWVASGIGFFSSGIALSDRTITFSEERIETWANVESVAVLAHIASLVLAIFMVVSITKQQDRRLR